jgi:hypothetical protein
LYAEKLRVDLIRRMPEHAARIRERPDEDILRQDQEHTRARLEHLTVKHQSGPVVAWRKLQGG